MLFTAVEQRRVQHDKLTENDTVVATAQRLSGRRSRTSCAFYPGRRTIVIVNGASPNETFWLEELRRETRATELDASKLEFYNELSFEDILKDAAALPPDSAIFWH